MPVSPSDPHSPNPARACRVGGGSQVPVPERLLSVSICIWIVSKATQLEDRVFTTVTGKPAKSLYNYLIGDLVNEANLREGTQGVPRLTIAFGTPTQRSDGRKRRRIFPCRAEENVRPHDCAALWACEHDQACPPCVAVHGRMGTAAAGRRQGQGVEGCSNS